MRGAPGSGKSTLIKNKGLEPYTLSADTIRTQYMNPVMTESGEFEISQKNDNDVWELLFKLLEIRMERGDFTVIDATHNNGKFINKYKQLVDKYRYNAFYYEMETDLQETLKRNSSREPHKRVPEEFVKLAHARIKNNKVPSFVKEVKDIDSILNYYTQNLDNYKRVDIFGDIHGCYDPLKEYFDNNPFSDDVAYIFAGDYIDRGPQNDKVMEFIFSIMEKPNVYLLEGNHENVMYKYICGMNTSKKNFEKYTRPQLDLLPMANFKTFRRKLRQCMMIEFNKENYLVTHGGLPRLPEKITLMSSDSLMKGIGNYDSAIDEIWEGNKNFNKGWIQVHGHRETGGSESSYCLESSVEYGGCLSVLQVTTSGRQVVEVKNNNFTLLKEEQYIIPDKTGLKTGVKAIDDMSKSSLIKTKLNNAGTVASLNFTQKAFRGRKWNDQTIKARGLFVSPTDGRIIARSYDKFFNMYERETTKPKSLKQNLKFPAKSFLKENGFLGILSVLDDNLLFASKSTVDGPFAKLFKDNFEEMTTPAYRKKLRDKLKKDNLSMVFEVVDPIEDPHIAYYSEKKIIHLETFKNKLETEKVELDEEFKEFMYSEKIEEKKLLGVFDDWDSLEAHIKIQEKNKIDEGIVVEDSDNFYFKVKAKEYSLWKEVRTLRSFVKGDYFDIRYARTHESVEIMSWYMANLEELRDLNILEIRKKYEEK